MAIARSTPRARGAPFARRAAFVGLLCAVVLLPRPSSNDFEFPALVNPWALLACALLMVLPLLDLARPWRLLHLDLLMLMAPVAGLMCEGRARAWPVLLAYAGLAYLFARMVSVARAPVPSRPSPLSHPQLTSALPRRWLVVGIVVLAAVHVNAAAQTRVSSDSAAGAVHGALRILHGESLYGASATTAAAPHGDVYGPVTYEAYVPLAGILSARAAAPYTTLLFVLLSAWLLFALGRRLRSTATGVLLAYCWLAFPLTLYEDALAFNDSIVAALLLATMLTATSPLRRGVAGALAVWSKLSPLALLPLLLAHGARRRPDARRDIATFALAFALATALVFLPAVAHSSLSTFVSRTVGFQGLRPPGDSLWSTLQNRYGEGSPWLATLARAGHGLLVALTGAVALLASRISRRQDTVGLAAMTAAVMIALQACLSYYAYSYILWFAPLVLLVLILTQPYSTSRTPQRVVISPPGSSSIRFSPL